MNELITTDADLDWLNDDSGEKLEAALFDLKRRNFHPVPYEAPMPLDGYEYEFYGPIAFSKPKYQSK